MVESGRLADVDATPKQLCLVAIGYHNLAGEPHTPPPNQAPSPCPALLSSIIYRPCPCPPPLTILHPLTLSLAPDPILPPPTSVVQLKLAMPDLACKNSQNARKIARLCLASSNRWIDTFQYTHEIAVADLKYELVSKRAADLTPEQLALVAGLSEALFDPLADS
jgi:hypothetical protein